MTSTQRILAPVDLSRPAEEAVRNALGMAAAFRADLHLVYVSESDDSGETPPNWPDLALVSEQSGGNIYRAVLHGSIAHTITVHAEILNADLVLMSRHPHRRLRRFWSKSVIDDVMSLSRRPVCVLPANRNEDSSIDGTGRILCVSGLDGRETTLVQHAAATAAAMDAELVLLHVLPEPTEALLHHGTPGASRPLSKHIAAAALDQLAVGLPVPVITSVMTGDEEHCIRRAAREHNAGIVYAARTHMKAAAAYGGVVEVLRNTLSCPLLTVPVDGGAAVVRTPRLKLAAIRRSGPVRASFPIPISAGR